MSSTPDDFLGVQVVYALPHEQRVVDVKVPRGTTIRAAAERSGIADYFPGLDFSDCEFGIFGTMKEPGTRVRAGDRIEIYRPLLDDPKAIRRRRARKPGDD
jgi:uncharacterized protein